MPALDTRMLKPGLRVAVAVSGGADSVALLRVLAARSGELGLVVHTAHLHHGLRGAEADADLEFCRELAAKLGVAFHEARVDAAAAAEPDRRAGKARETLEEAARRVRYAWFRELLIKNGLDGNGPNGNGLVGEKLDAIATAHTLDDQAETVLGKFLRGAWTEGLAGIAPALVYADGGVVLRPLLGAMRAEIEAYLRAVGQDWREDSTNRHLTFTRNRIRHELLPVLEGWNPRLKEHLAQMAELARDEEAWWDAEVARIAPQMLLAGRPVRGGGRAANPGLETGLAIDMTRMAALAPALQRRLLRHAAARFGVSLDFAATESLRSLALDARAGQKRTLPAGLLAERTPRELRLSTATAGPAAGELEWTVPIPGEIEAPVFGVRLKVSAGPTKLGSGGHGANQHGASQDAEKQGDAAEAAPMRATLRNWKAGDRVRLRHSARIHKVKEVLAHLRVTGSDRALWPVLEVAGRIVWMRGVELEPEGDLAIEAEFCGGAETGLDQEPGSGAK